MKKNKYRALISSVGATIAYALTACTASGQTLQASLTSGFGFTFAKGSFDNGATDVVRGGTLYTFTTTSPGSFQFDAFCSEPLTVIQEGIFTYDITPLSQLTNADKVARLVSQYLASPKAILDAAGAQWAIWEVMYETNPVFSLNSGSTYIDRNHNISSANSQDKANEYLANINNYAPANIVYLKTPISQDMIAITPIPEPTSLGLSVLPGLLLLRRKR